MRTKWILAAAMSFAFPLVSQAWQISPGALMNSVNEHILSIPDGVFSVSADYQSALKKDTTRISGTIYFFENPVETDSLKLFIMLINDNIVKAYDGAQLYLFNHHLKIISVYNRLTYPDLESVIEGGFGSLIFYDKFLFKRPHPFNLELYEKAKIYRENANYKLVYTDTTLNQYRMDETDPEWMTIRTEYLIDSGDYSVLEREEWIHFLKKPQYYKLRFSTIKPLNNVSFSQLVQLDSMEKEGYKLNFPEPNGAASYPKLHFDTGETIPNFKFENYSGEEVFLDSLITGRIGILEFWYKSCLPCLKSLPELNNLQKIYGNRGLDILAINGSDYNRKDAIAVFWKERNLEFPTYFDTGKTAIKSLGVRGFPTSILFESKSRKVIKVYHAYSADLAEKMSKDIEAYLQGGE